MEHRFERLFKSYKDQTATPEELEEFFELIQSGSCDNSLESDIFDTLKDTSPGIFLTDDSSKDETFERIAKAQGLDKSEPSTFASVCRFFRQSFSERRRSFIESAQSFSTGGRWQTIAASLIFIATTSAWFFYGQQSNSADKHHSGKAVFILPDTQVAAFKACAYRPPL